MKRLLAVAVALVVVASPAWAQRSELSLFAGYNTPGDIEKKAPTVQDLEIEGAFTWGLRAGHFFTTNVGVEASWARQESELVFGTAAGSTELFELHLDQLQASFVYQFAGDQSRLRPFLAAGLGAAFFSAPELDGETKLSWSLGTGLKWFASQRLGARLEARYSPTYLNDTDSDFCDPFGFCQGWLHQFELTGAVTFRF
jgi:outer membrane protein W